jgi:hypothetical protein
LGASGVVVETPPGNCRVTGKRADAPVIDLVTITGARTFRCFENGSRNCL